MARFVRHLVLVGATALCVSSARADVPSAAHSTAPTYITLVGALGGVSDSASGQFTVVVRGLTDEPFINASVVIDFSQCSDVAICSDQMDPRATVVCFAKTVRKFTNTSGAVTFTVLGGSNGAGNAA